MSTRVNRTTKRIFTGICLFLFIANIWMNISTVVTTIEKNHHQSVRALATELKISCSSTCATPPPFAYHSQELMFDKGRHNSYYKTCCISASIWGTTFIVHLFEVMNHKICRFFFFWFNALCVYMVCKLNSSVSPFVYSNFFVLPSCSSI